MTIIHGMSNADYHALSSVSSSQLKPMLRSPAHFLASLAKKKEPTANMVLGSLVHTLYLEPQKFDSEYVVSEKHDRRTTAGKEAAARFEAAAQGKTVITEDQAFAAELMVMELRKNDADILIDSGGYVESSIFYTDPETGIDCRIRPDWHMPPCDEWPNGIILDLKTTDDAREQAFRRTVETFGYDLSAAMYSHGFQVHYQTENPPVFLFLVVERDEAYGVMCYEADDELLSLGHNKYRRAIALLQECRESNQYRGYPNSIQKLKPAAWAVKLGE